MRRLSERIDTQLFERTALSHNLEKDLEDAILRELELFLLELGAGNILCRGKKGADRIAGARFQRNSRGRMLDRTTTQVGVGTKAA